MRNRFDLNSVAEILGPFAFLAESVDDMRIVLKNLNHEYVYVNPHWLSEVGINNSESVLGKTSVELFSHWRGDRYMEEEKRVMETGAVLDYFEEWIDTRGEKNRFRTIKAPWIEQGEIKGVVNISIPAHRILSRESRSDVAPNVVVWLIENAMENISISELAEIHHMSRKTFERRFKQLAGISPSKYRLNLRIEKAKKLLKANDIDLALIALQCGFCDQSHFTRVFRQQQGITPLQYHKQKRRTSG